MTLLFISSPLISFLLVIFLAQIKRLRLYGEFRVQKIIFFFFTNYLLTYLPLRKTHT